jgi:AbiV family abortive infection protein
MELAGTDLLHGAVYALEQAGHLLHDAVLLYQKGRYASSVALAVFAKEELGRFEILLEHYIRVMENGQPISRASIVNKCDDHAEKLRRSDMGEIDFDSIGNPDLALEILKGPWGSEQQKQALKRAEDLRKRKARRTPHELHRKRLNAIYVEPSEFGKGWNRPAQMSRQECLRLLKSVSYEYDCRHFWYEKSAKDSTTVVAQWKERPLLPKPLHP